MNHLETIRQHRNKTAVLSALKALTTLGDLPAEARPALLDAYHYYNEAPIRRDPGAPARSALLGALRRDLQHADIPLLEAAAQTYEEVPPGFEEEAGTLRAAAVVALNDVDADRAAFHAARLLAEGGLTMSGEPALSAVRVLAVQGRTVLLYHYALHGEVPEALSEALKMLDTIPGGMLPPLVERFTGSENELVLAGLFDLLLAHPAARVDPIAAFLREPSRRFGAYRYLTTVLARSETAFDVLLEAALQEDRSAYAAMLREALIPVAERPGARKALTHLDRVLRA